MSRLGQEHPSKSEKGDRHTLIECKHGRSIRDCTHFGNPQAGVGIVFSVFEFLCFHIICPFVLSFFRSHSFTCRFCLGLGFCLRLGRAIAS
jgi:hypothetical protein